MNNNNYPVRRKGQGSSLVPSFSPANSYRIPSNIIPRHVNNNRNLGAQAKVRIHIKNARGDEMDIYQTQQVLNLLNNNHSTWIVGGNSTNRNYRRKR